MASPLQQKKQSSSSTMEDAREKPSETSQLFYVIRKCESLEDCMFYLDSETAKEDDIEYESFDIMVDAVEYIYESFGPKSSVAASVKNATAFSRAAASPSPTPKAATSPSPPAAAATLPATKKTTTTTPRKRSAQDAALEAESEAPPRKKAAPPRGFDWVKSKRDDPAVKPKRQLNFEQKFDSTLELLTKYKTKYGHCRVPDIRVKKGEHASAEQNDLEEFKGLRRWVTNMREQVRLYIENVDSSALNKTQVQKLVDLGLDNVKKTAGNPKPDKPKNMIKKDPKFEEMFAKLQSFKEEHGHLSVPHLPTSSLRNWVLRMRKSYTELKAGRATVLTAQKIARLTEIGFNLNPPKRRAWDERALEWLEYKTKHGREPMSETTLGQWVRKMRRKYRDMNEGKPTAITEQQVEKLESWGFKWTPSINMTQPIGPRKSWDERFVDLVQYKNEKGDTLVPQNYPGNCLYCYRYCRGLRCNSLFTNILRYTLCLFLLSLRVQSSASGFTDSATSTKNF
jgi:hypothetical protein